MTPPRRPTEWLVWGALALTVLGIAAAFVLKQFNTRRFVDSLPVFFQVPEFTLTNQHGQPVTLADLRGQVWLADIIFTSCAGPCPKMTQLMSELQSALPASAPVKLLTLTTHPEYDTPAVLKAYAQRFGAQPGRWHFLTGLKPQIVHLAIDGLKFTALDKDPAQRESAADLFIHSTTIVVVDGQGRARASIETDQPEAREQVLRAVEKLLREQ